jgi:hypothetical protein
VTHPAASRRSVNNGNIDLVVIGTHFDNSDHPLQGGWQVTNRHSGGLGNITIERFVLQPTTVGQSLTTIAGTIYFSQLHFSESQHSPHVCWCDECV